MDNDDDLMVCIRQRKVVMEKSNSAERKEGKKKERRAVKERERERERERVNE